MIVESSNATRSMTSSPSRSKAFTWWKQKNASVSQVPRSAPVALSNTWKRAGADPSQT